MTKTILTGLTLATILLTIGISSQSFALPIADNTQSDVPQTITTGNLVPDGQQWVLVAIPPTHKGGDTIYQVIPKPTEQIDATPLEQPSDPHPLIQVSTTTHKGDTSAYQWVPQQNPDPKDFVS